MELTRGQDKLNIKGIRGRINEQYIILMNFKLLCFKKSSNFKVDWNVCCEWCELIAVKKKQSTLEKKKKWENRLWDSSFLFHSLPNVSVWIWSDIKLSLPRTLPWFSNTHFIWSLLCLEANLDQKNKTELFHMLTVFVTSLHCRSSFKRQVEYPTLFLCAFVFLWIKSIW